MLWQMKRRVELISGTCRTLWVVRSWSGSWVGAADWLLQCPLIHETQKFGFFPYNQISPPGARSGACCRVAQIARVHLLLSRGSGQCAGACTDPCPMCPRGWATSMVGTRVALVFPGMP